MTKDPPATLDEPDTDCEVIEKLRVEIVRLRAALKDIGQYTGDPAVRRVVVTALEQSDVVQFHDNRILPAEPHGVRIAAADHEQKAPE